MNQPNYVKGYGSSTARLMIVGEAPGKTEDECGLPFMGPAGQILDDCLKVAGISREEVYITNVVKVRPPNNDLKSLEQIGYKIEDFVPQLWDEIATIAPNCILALGNTALKTLTGCNGIQKYRGSILPNCRSGTPKVVASIHPASLLHEAKTELKNWKEKAWIQFDINRAVKESLTKSLIYPERSLLSCTSSIDFIRFLERGGAKRHCPVTLDVETFKTFPLCFGFAFNRFEAMSVPIFNELTSVNPSGIPFNDLVSIWRILSQFIGDMDAKIITQNGEFDMEIASNVKCNFKVWFDTMYAWHTLFPEMPKKLQFMTSILTDEPYYKDERTDYNPKKDKLDKLLSYNCKDAVITYEVYEKEVELLKKVGNHVGADLEDFFWHRMMPLQAMYFEMCQRGINVDAVALSELRVKYKERVKETHYKLISCIQACGHNVEVNVSSPKQVGQLLYSVLKCPLRKDTAEDTLKALSNNALKDEPRKNVVKYILEERKLKKTVGTYLATPCCGDGRARTQVKVCGTETGRTSNTKRECPISVAPEGLAFQTLTKYGDTGADLRRMFIPDAGKIFVEPDLSQAEDRVVCVLAEDWESLATLQKTEFKYNKQGLKDDRHTLTAVIVCNKSFDFITDEDRQVGKRTRHAFNYKVGKHQLMLTLAGEGVFVSEWKAGKYLEAVARASPKISAIFHQGIVDALQRDGMWLITPYGRARQFFNRWGDELFKEAYAEIPQSTISDHLKFAMLRIKARRPETEFLMESHDSFVAQIDDNTDVLTSFCHLVKEELEFPVDFSKCSLPRDYKLVIPADFKVGKNLLEMQKFKVS